MWRAADYKLVAEKSEVFEYAVDGLSFELNQNDRLIAIDSRGHYCRMKLLWSDDENQLSRGDASARECERCWLSTEMIGEFQSTIKMEPSVGTVLKHQFSRDGQILLRIQSKGTYFEPEYEILAIEVISLEDSVPLIIQLDADRRYRNGLPLLAENGESVLVCSISTTEVYKATTNAHVDHFV